MKLPVEVRVSRYTGGRDGDGISLTVIDRISGCMIVECDIDLIEWANAITGLSGNAVCDLVVGGAGKVSEYKTEIVDVPSGDWKSRGAIAAQAIAPLEVDGWKGSLADAANHHRSIGGNKQSVGFSRLVPLSEENVEKRIADMTKSGWQFPRGFSADDMREMAKNGAA